MKKIVILLSAFITFNGLAMQDQNEPTNAIVLRRPRSNSMSVSAVPIIQQVQPSHTNLYIPQTYDLTEVLEKESRCCFCWARWFFRPASIVAPILATIVIGLSEYFMKTNTKTSSVFNCIGLGLTALGALMSSLLALTNDNLQNIDTYLSKNNNIGG